MHHPIKTISRLLLLPLAATSLLACTNSDKQEQPMEATAQSSIVAAQGVPGGVQTNVITVDAVVSAIDYNKRTVTLKDGKGNQRTLQVGQEAVNFNQIKVGDPVTVQFIEQMAVQVLDKGAAKVSGGSAAMVAAAPAGAIPGGMAAETVQLTGSITAVDLPKHTATLKFEDGTSEVVNVRPDIKLSQNDVGRQVVIQMTRAMAISIVKQ